MRTSTATALALVAGLCVAAGAVAQPTTPTPAPPKAKDPDVAAIRAVALDYIEGWYEASPERMARAVHPELAKRIIVTEDGMSRVEGMGATKLVANVRAGGGKATPKARQRKEVWVLDRFENAASVRVVASDWVDYLHLAKIDGRWQIVNVLWERFPTSGRK